MIVRGSIESGSHGLSFRESSESCQKNTDSVMVKVYYLHSPSNKHAVFIYNFYSCR